MSIFESHISYFHPKFLLKDRDDHLKKNFSGQVLVKCYLAAFSVLRKYNYQIWVKAQFY